MAETLKTRAERKDAYRKKVNETAQVVIEKILIEYKRLKTLECCKDMPEEKLVKYAFDYGSSLLNLMIKQRPQEKQLLKDAAKVIIEKVSKGKK